MGNFIKQNDLTAFSTSTQAILVTDCYDENIKQYLTLAEFHSESNDTDDKMTFIYQYIKSYLYDNQSRDLIYNTFLQTYAKICNINISHNDKEDYVSIEELNEKFNCESNFSFNIVTSFAYDVDFIKFENSCLTPLFNGKETLSREQIQIIAEKYFDKSSFIVLFDSENYIKNCEFLKFLII